MELHGAVVVVTGASAGIGEATALRFARAGSRVVATARRLDRVETLAERIRAEGGIALPLRCDVTDADDIRATVDAVMDAHARCDVLVNNAGVPGGGPFHDLTAEQIEGIVRVNLLGVLQTTRAFLPMLLEQRRGHVVNVASIAGRFAAPGAAVYAATKHAVVAFSESLDATTRRAGVLVTAVNPAFVKTEGFPAQRPRVVTLTADRVAGAILKVVRDGIAPELTVPRWIAALQAFRVLTPPLYRWGMNRAARRYAD